MAKCCGQPSACSGSSAGASAEDTPCAWFGRMIQNCHQYATQAKEAGRPIVCIMCEYTPRELIMAAGGVPVCLCGGSAETIPDAEEHLPANLCPLVKSTYGYHLQRSNPFLEMADLVVGETTCDGKKKMFELMAESRPMYVLELPQRADDGDALEHWVGELGKFRAHLEERFKTSITNEAIRDATGIMNRERALRRELAEQMTPEGPVLSGRQLLSLKSSISGIDADLRQYEKALELLRAKQAEANGNGKVRVLMTGVPMAHGAERVLEIIEASGGLVVAMENCTGLKPLLDDVDETAADPVRALAEKYYRLPCSVMTRNDRRLDILREMSQKYRPECVIELIWQACITYDVETNRVKRVAEQDLGLPYLRIETDYSPSDSARIAMRVEALFETVRAAGAGEAGRVMKRIAYVNPFVPPEWIEAHGLRPKRLQVCSAEERRPVEAVRGVCPYVGALLQSVRADRETSAVILTTTCDQMRRCAGLLGQEGTCPVFLLNVPATWQTPTARELYVDELRRLGRFLVRIGGQHPVPDRLADVMREHEERRVQGSGFRVQDSASNRNGRPRLALLGGPSLDDDGTIWDLIEQAGGQVILDGTEGGQRTQPERFDTTRLRDDPLGELARAYFDGIPDAFRRPNTRLYEWLQREIRAREIQGIILQRYVWCDIWHAEVGRLKQRSPIPLVDLDEIDAGGVSARTVARLEAFLEILQ